MIPKSRFLIRIVYDKRKNLQPSFKLKQPTVSSWIQQISFSFDRFLRLEMPCPE